VSARSTRGVAQLIDDIFERPADEGISLAMIVQQGGDVVAERYGTQPENVFQPAQQIDADTTLISWSMAKSITHAAVGVLVLDGRLDVDAPAPVPEWMGTPKSAITVLDLLEMRSGLRFVEDYVDEGTSHCIEMLFGDSGPSHAAYAAALPLDHEPGTVWNYSSGTSNIVARIVGDIVTGTIGGDPAERERAVGEFLGRRLFAPTGMSSATPKFDAAGDFVGSSYVYATARDFARFGELYRHDGVTRMGAGDRILPAGWLDHARTTIAVDPETSMGYGRHWWTWPWFPGSVACHGYQGQFTLVVPARELVMVHLGLTPADVAPLLVRRLIDLVGSL
jgi:CubicO group peptidase (beta-lactamase class C family)